MKANSTTVRLTVMSLVLYALFVWHGMTYEPYGNNTITSALGGWLDTMQVQQIPQNTSVTQPKQMSATTKAPVVSNNATSTPNNTQNASNNQVNSGTNKKTGRKYEFSKIAFDITRVFRHKENGISFAVFEFDWTNTSNEPIDFTGGNVNLEVYQNGIQCEYGLTFDIENNLGTKIMPGKSLKSYRAFELVDNSEIKVYVSEYFKNADPYVFTVNFNK